MANTLVGIITNVSIDEIKYLDATEIIPGFYGFNYTNYNKPLPEILDRCIIIHDIDAYLISSPLVQKYVDETMMKFI